MLVMAERGPFMVVTLLISEIEEEISKNNYSGIRKPDTQNLDSSGYLTFCVWYSKMTYKLADNLYPWPKLF